MTLKKKLEDLSKEARYSGQSEFIFLMDFLKDSFEPRNQENKRLLLTICDEFIDHSNYIKTKLLSCQK